MAVSGCDEYSGSPTIQLYSRHLKPASVLEAKLDGQPINVTSMDVNAAGRLHASSSAPRVTFVRWSANRNRYEVFSPRYQGIHVDFLASAFRAGRPFEVLVKAEGRPAPHRPAVWQVLARPTDGCSLP